MGSPARTLYVTDLDGTLLDENARLSPASRRGVLRLLDAGVPLTFATARSVEGTRAIVGELPLELPMVALNGAFVSRLDGTHLRVSAIDRQLAEQVVEAAEAVGLGPVLSTHAPHGDGLLWREVANEGQAWSLREKREARDPRLRQVTDWSATFEDQVLCITLIGPRDTLEALRRRLPPARHQFYENAYSPGWWWLTIHGEEATKGHGLRWLRTQLEGIDRMVVFGDHDNDLEMFELADHAVAVQNATERLRAAAHEHIGPHHHDSVIDWLLRETGA